MRLAHEVRDVARIGVREHVHQLLLQARRVVLRVDVHERRVGVPLLRQDPVDVEALALEAAQRRREHRHKEKHVLERLAREHRLGKRHGDLEPVDVQRARNVQLEPLAALDGHRRAPLHVAELGARVAQHARLLQPCAIDLDDHKRRAQPRHVALDLVARRGTLLVEKERRALEHRVAHGARARRVAQHAPRDGKALLDQAAQVRRAQRRVQLRLEHVVVRRDKHVLAEQHVRVRVVDDGNVGRAAQRVRVSRARPIVLARLAHAEQQRRAAHGLAQVARQRVELARDAPEHVEVRVGGAAVRVKRRRIAHQHAHELVDARLVRHAAAAQERHGVRAKVDVRERCAERGRGAAGRRKVGRGRRGVAARDGHYARGAQPRIVRGSEPHAGEERKHGARLGVGRRRRRAQALDDRRAARVRAQLELGRIDGRERSDRPVHRGGRRVGAHLGRRAANDAARRVGGHKRHLRGGRPRVAALGNVLEQVG